MKTLVTLCFMVLLGIVVAKNGRGPCGCRRVFEFCANDYTTYHSICEYKCKHPSTRFQDWYILYQGPCFRPYLSDSERGLSGTRATYDPTGPAYIPTATYDPTCPTTTMVPPLIRGYEWEPRTGSSYKFHTAAEFWYDADDICRAEGGYLAIINSKTESRILKDMFNKYTFAMLTGTPDRFKSYASLGFRKLDGRWETVQNESLEDAGFDEWSPGEPSNWGGIEDCGTMYWDGLLNDALCDTTRFPFICEDTPSRE